jgi:hypothetical protein
VLNAISLAARNYLAQKDRAGGIAVSSAGTFDGMVAAFLLGAVLPDAEQLTILVSVGAGVACAAALAMLVTLRHPVRTSTAPPTGPRVTVRATPRRRRGCSSTSLWSFIICRRRTAPARFHNCNRPDSRVTPQTTTGETR